MSRSDRWHSASDKQAFARAIEDVDLVVEQCRAGIRVFERAIKSLHSQRNAWSAGPNLPREILQEIFCMTIGKKDSLRYRYLTWVCRHWRDSALDCPKLWSFITVDGRNNECQILPLLSLSQGFPLTMKVSYNGIASPTPGFSLRSHLHFKDP